MASEEKQHVNKTNRKRKRDTLSVVPSAKSSPSSSSTVNSQAPIGINVVEFAEARALELHNMVEGIAMADRTGKKRLFQSLPKHMRRRAMSYNVKRMPVRLREQAKKEMEKNKLDAKTTKKSRRQRRKAKELLKDYNCRKKQNIWLETHIWHAKRMKMTNAWGYRLAEHPSDKGFRAAHRATAKNCLLQDISYYGCIEVKGNRKDILSAMSLLTRVELGSTIGSLDCMNNGKEGHVLLYHRDCYPFGAIGPVSFLWRQNFCTKRSSTVDDGSASESHQLWIWTHPALFDEVFQAIQEACETVTTTTVAQDSASQVDNPSSASKEKNISCNTKQKESITISSLRFDLARFRLTGPLSHSLLISMLELPAQNKPVQNEECLMDNGSNLIGKDKQRLPVENGRDNTGHETSNCGCNMTKDSQVDGDEPLLSSEAFWERLKSSSSSSMLPAYSVIGLTVVDPRLGMPAIRTSIDASLTEQHFSKGAIRPSPSSSDLFFTKCPSLIAASNIWDADTRQHVKENKITEENLNEMRSKLLVPGSRLDLGDRTSHVPVLLVQQPGSDGYAGGWDIILPSGWAMAFWMALVYRGARVGGLRESRNCSLECEEPYFPRDVPDTRSGMHYNKEMQTEEENKYDRYPPAKRPNYAKLGMLSPFFNPWSQLVEEWNLEASRKEIVPTKDAKLELQNLSPLERVIDDISTMRRQGINNATSLPRQDTEQNAVQSATLFNHRQPKSETLQAGELMNGDMKTEGKSTPDDSKLTFFVLRDLCQLRLLRNVTTNLQAKISRSKPCRTSDSTLDTRPLANIMTRYPRALIGVSLRMLNKGYPLPNATVSIPSMVDLEALQQDKAFGGPVEPHHKGSTRNDSEKNTLIGSCTRKIIGFVTSGQYSLSRGFGVGIGYCALPGLVELLTTSNQAVVLIRNTKTLQYRMALIQKIL